MSADETIVMNYRRAGYGIKGPKSEAPGGYGCISKDGHRRIWYQKKLRMEHDVIWEAAHGPIPDGLVVHHKDGNKLHNAVDNLVVLSREAHSKEHAGYRLVDGTWNKPCTKCGLMKPLTEFNKARQHRPDGIRPSCKACTQACDRNKALGGGYKITPISESRRSA